MILPILQVIIPLTSAILCFLFNNHKLSWILSFITTSTTLFVSSLLLCKTYNGEIINYNVGGWIAPYGIELRIDLFNAVVLCLINFISLMSVLYGFYINKKEIDEGKIAGLYSIFLFCLSGFIGILVTNDVFNIYVFLEISSLSSYILVAMGRQKSSLTASFEYLINGTIGATFYLIGVGLLYSATGTLNISDLALKVSHLQNSLIVQSGFIFIVIGLLVKIALFPLNRWLVNAYSASPSFVTIFFSGTATKVMIYVLLRIYYSIFYASSLFIPPYLTHLLLILALCGIVFGGLLAIVEKDLKKLLAYSSVAQIGYIILGISLNSRAGLTAAIIHIISHSIVKSALFMVIGCTSYKTGTTNIENLNRSSIFIILGMSLIGVPITFGFVAKWYLLKSIINSSLWAPLVIFVLGSFLSVIYIWKAIEKMCLKTSQEVGIAQIPITMLLCSWFMIIPMVIFGIYSKPIVDIADKISTFLLQ
ncbi:proton-conducting transporter membrane subunit [Candidatus Mesenet endosymbiont of Agriotes lineatus]|uniref:proton-conducting transporter transmembrane domain-containing protein n=1 Tax=Candidatus Mesenet endosymbiont of Agriotes lineatus TaxID=3077948 RepID=UPI0030CEE519